MQYPNGSNHVITCTNILFEFATHKEMYEKAEIKKRNRQKTALLSPIQSSHGYGIGSIGLGSLAGIRCWLCIHKSQLQLCIQISQFSMPSRHALFVRTMLPAPWRRPHREPILLSAIIPVAHNDRITKCEVFFGKVFWWNWKENPTGGDMKMRHGVDTSNMNCILWCCWINYA